MGKRRLAVALASVAVLIGGCTSAPGSNDANDPNNNSAKLHQQAQTYLANFDKAVQQAGGLAAFVPVGEVTLFVGEDWGPDLDGNAAKIAFMGGDFTASIALPANTPADGEIRWQDGRVEKTAILSANAAFSQMTAKASECTQCTTALVVTGATLTTVTFDTSRGPAQAPAWEFTLEHTPVKIARLAVASKTITVPEVAWDPNNAPIGMPVHSAQITADDLTLTVNFVGAGAGADKPCGADYTAEAVEGTNGVVVIVYAHASGTPVACTLEGHPRSAQVKLSAPLGNRVVLEVQTGRPVPVTHE